MDWLTWSAQKQINISDNRRIIHRRIQQKQFQGIGSLDQICDRYIDQHRQDAKRRSGNRIDARQVSRREITSSPRTAVEPIADSPARIRRVRLIPTRQDRDSRGIERSR